jgi:Uncharacterized conserved protein
MEARQEDVFPRLPGKQEFVTESASLRPDVSIFDLVNAVNAVLKRFAKREDLRDIFEDKWSVSEKIEHLMRLSSQRPTLKFSELFEEATSRSEVVVTFLALLELIRLKQLVVTQPQPFGDIEICRAPTPAPAAAGVTTEASSSTAGDASSLAS